MINICLIVFPKFQMLAYVLATETLRIANKVAGEQVFSWETVAVSGGPTEASNGAFAVPDVASFETTHPADLVLLCAGYDPLDNINAALRAFLARTNSSGALLGGMDTGSMILAHLGYLDGYEAVMHHEAESGFQETWPDITIVDQIYCLNGKRLTAAGGTSTGDAMLAWIEEVHSISLAHATSDAMVHGQIREGGEKQQLFRITDPQIQAMRRIMLENIGQDITIAEIAQKLGTTYKRLLNRSRKSEGCTPREYFQKTRLERAADFLRDTKMPITEIAAAVGFGSLAAMSKSFKIHFGLNPRDFRLKYQQR